VARRQAEAATDFIQRSPLTKVGVHAFHDLLHHKRQKDNRVHYRWKREYGGLRTDQAKRLKDLEKENARLKRLLADAELDKAILREAASGCRRRAQLNF